MARTNRTAQAENQKDAVREKEDPDRTRLKLSTAEARREYQRRYYQMHKEKAKEYQRQYNLTHKKKARLGRGKSSATASREVVRSTFNTADIMHSPVEKTLKILEKIIKGERLFTM
jgi:ribosomal protein L13E